MVEKIKRSYLWKKVLNEIYESSPTLWFSNNKLSFWEDRHGLARELNISGSSLGKSLIFLQETKLVELQQQNPEDRGEQTIVLTEQGFNVALENEKAEGWERLQLVACYAAATLAFIAVFSFIQSLVGEPLTLEYRVLLSSVFLLVFGSVFGLSVMIWKVINRTIGL